MAARSAPRSEPAKVQFARPTATPRGARSAALLKGMMLLAPRLDGESFPVWIATRSRDRGVGSTKRWQAVLTMSCELELLRGRPYDLPGCAVSADP